MKKFKKIEKKMAEQSKELIESGLIPENSKILIAFSGGPDSVFLYNYLNSLKSRLSLEISLAYVNHNLRHDVDNDLEFVKGFALEKGIGYYIESVDVKGYSRQNKKSIELAARELRYEAIENIRKKIGYDKIATGHNLDDNVETFIFRLLRGTSLNGLKGIPKIRGNIVRPILEFEKSEILTFLENKSQKYIIDYTNNENDYTRNFIRNKIFPDFNKINPNFKQKIFDLIEEINEREIETSADNRQCIFYKEGQILVKNTDKITKKDKFAEFLKQNQISISREKINQIFESFFDKNGDLKNEGSREFYLGKGKVLRNKYGKIEIADDSDVKKNIETLQNSSSNKSVDKIQILKGKQSIRWYNYQIAFYENAAELKDCFVNDENMDYTFYKIAEGITIDEVFVRSRKNGDRIFIKNLGHKKIKKIFIDEKISKWEREFLPVVEAEIFENQYFPLDENNNIGENGTPEIRKLKYKDGHKKTKEILAISDIKFSKFLEKIHKDDIEKLKNDSKLLVIGRKNDR